MRSAFEEVQMTSESAFTSAEQLTYETATSPGWRSRQALKATGGQESASEHPAARSGKTTTRSGFRILAVSAMK